MRLVLQLSLLFTLICSGALSAQQQVQSNTVPCPGVPGACGYQNTNTSVQRGGPQAPLNGNGTLGVIYDQQKCGLDYTSASQRIGKRFTPQGINQPAPFVIAGIPACAVIEKAYLWAEGSGNGAAQTANIAGPFGTQAFPMTVVGQGPDKCWGYSGSYTYRADVTAVVGGNGTYNISGLLTNPPTAGNDMDGATLLVVWSLPTATWAGRIIIADGAIVINGGNTTYNMPITPAVCGATTGGRGFFGVGDIQFNPNSWSANGSAAPLSWNWWDFKDVATTVATGATTAPFSVSSSGDCYNLCIAGLYFRTTTCTTCPQVSAMTATTSTTQTTCSNCNGTATITNVTGGTGPYTYSWNTVPVQTTATATGLCPGTYVCTITSANNCQTTTVTVTITSAGGGLTISNTPPTNVLCAGGSTGSAVATCNGGTGPFTFTWSPTVNANTVGNTSTATNLAVGTYIATVTDANGCTGQQTFVITEPPALSSTYTQTNVACNGNSTGSATITGAGGVGPYTFSWSPTPPSNNTNGNSNTGNNLIATGYNVIVIDANGCSTSQSITITQPAPFIATATSTASTCNQPNGTITVTTQGGIGAPTYNWVPGNYTNATVTNLPSGPYTVTATDGNGCTSTASVTIAPSVNMTVTETQTNLLCFQDNSGTATVTHSGNSGPLSYVWTPSVSTTGTATGLAAGTYVVDASDPNGCFTSSTFTITEPPQLTATVGGFNVTCFGACNGQMVTIPTGGTGNYSFNWSSGCTQPSCSNVCAGTYNVTVSDQNGCTTTGTTTVTEPPQIVITTSFDTAHCGQSDGAAYANATGGTGQLSYNWLPNTPGNSISNVPGGNQYCVVTDANGCADTATVIVFNQQGVIASIGQVTSVGCFGGNNGAATANLTGGTGPYTISWNTSPAQSTSTITGLTAGSYIVTATDADGCSSSATAVVTQPPVLTLAASSAPSSICMGQPTTLTATPTGGTANYTMLWLPNNLVGASQTVTPQTSGTYTVGVTDANGCTATATTSVTVNPLPVAGLVGDVLSGCAPLCVNFSDQTTLSAGTIIAWNWDFGDQSQGSTQNGNHCYTTAGVYTVSLTVTSNNGCSNTITMNNYVNVFGIPTAAFVAGPQPTTELNPLITFTDMSVGATTWNWSFGDMIPASTSTQQNPSFYYSVSGCYDVVLEVSSANGCTASTTEEVCIEPDVAIYVPNAFTPNGDGHNDFFFAQGVGINPEHFEMWIFDRWGNLIFYANSINDHWDGRVQGHSDICQQDVYVWKIRCFDLQDRRIQRIGHVTLTM